MLIAQAPQQAYENLPADQVGDENMFLFILLSEIGVTLIVVLILYYIIIKPNKDRQKQEQADREKNNNSSN